MARGPGTTVDVGSEPAIGDADAVAGEAEPSVGDADAVAVAVAVEVAVGLEPSLAGVDAVGLRVEVGAQAATDRGETEQYEVVSRGMES